MLDRIRKAPLLRGFGRMGALFYLAVVAPTLIAILYFGFLAEDVYISESKFILKSPDQTAPSAIGVLLQGVGFSKADEEIYAARAFAASRDALRELNRDDYVRRAYGDPRYAFVSRFDPMGWDDSFEALYQYYGKMVTVAEETTSSITTLTVRAFSAQDAHRINERLLERSEALVNQLNIRGREDLVAVATREVDEAKLKSQNAAIALSNYRNREGVVDPVAQATAKLEMVSKLQDELITAKTLVQQLRRFTPDNPQIPVQESRIASLEQQMNAELGKVVGDRRSLAATSVGYERLLLENQFAEKQLAAAMASLEEAKNEARRKQAYIERIVEPNEPDKPMEPRRLRAILTTLALGLVAWGILRMLVAGVKEHGE